MIAVQEYWKQRGRDGDALMSLVEGALGAQSSPGALGECLLRLAGLAAAVHMAETGAQEAAADGADAPGGICAGGRTGRGA